jgi:hypothetical protein
MVRAFGEKHIYFRMTSGGAMRYIVRIWDYTVSSGIWFNMTFHDLDIAKKVRDEQLAKLVLEKINHGNHLIDF